MDDVRLQFCQNYTKEVIKETGGKWENMSYGQKIMIIKIMKELKRFLDKFYKENYENICMWANINEKDIQLMETTADLSRLKRLNYII